VTYRESDETYYMFYSAVEKMDVEPFVVSLLSLAHTKTPTVEDSWVREGELFPEIEWSKSGALLVRDDYPEEPHYLIWGDTHISLASSTDLINYTNEIEFFIDTRDTHFDSHLVESGPEPLLMDDGNYLFIYNSARKDPVLDDHLQYNVGWVILDGTNPKNILQRSETPLLSPDLAWEQGGLVNHVVFLEAAKPMGNNQYLCFYGGADSVTGAAVITVNYHDEETVEEVSF
jgi:predicted GH43/DUF377 family glycosyl hydrolase